MAGGADLVRRATRFAAAAHEGQTRKDGATPYVRHPLRVAGEAALRGLGPEAVAAAWLHDVVEDTAATSEDLAREFGPGVAGLVAELTNRFTRSASPGLGRRERKALEAERLRGASREAKVLKMLDRLDNLRDAGPLDDGFRRTYARETRELMEAIGDADPALRDEVLAAAGRLEAGAAGPG